MAQAVDNEAVMIPHSRADAGTSARTLSVGLFLSGKLARSGRDAEVRAASAWDSGATSHLDRAQCDAAEFAIAWGKVPEVVDARSLPMVSWSTGLEKR